MHLHVHEQCKDVTELLKICIFQMQFCKFKSKNLQSLTSVKCRYEVHHIPDNEYWMI